MRRRRHHHPEGIAVASSCPDCAPQIGSPPVEDGRCMVVIHASHAAELVALGWIRTDYPHEPPDVTCLHYHLEHWEGGHGGCCGMDGGQ